MVIAEQFQIDPEGEDFSAAISSGSQCLDLSALEGCEQRIPAVRSNASRGDRAFQGPLQKDRSGKS